LWNFHQPCTSNHTEQQEALLLFFHSTTEVDMANNSASDKPKGTAKRGFAAMDEATQRAIASKGGQAAHQKGTAHEFDSEEARRAGQKGGEAVSRDREHMAAIGRKGGESRQSAARAAAEKNGGRSSSAGSEQSARGGNKQ
jgi:general stress protein YciG